MGTNTPHLSLFKPDPTELVDVAEQLNENYDKVDSGVLGLDSRVGALEGVSGLSTNWTAYTPVITIEDGLTVFTTTITHAEYFVLGEIVHVDVAAVILTATATYTGAAPPPFIDLSVPFETKKRYMQGNLKFIPPSGSGHLGKYFVPVYSNGVSGDGGDKIYFAPVTNDGSFNTMFDATVNLTVPVNTILRFAFSYRTNGVVA